MKEMTLNSNRICNDTIVSNIFIDKYMKDANGEFVKVYLYLLRCLTLSTPHITTADIADKLNLTEKDIVRALKYWTKVSVLSVDFGNNEEEPSSITFLPLGETPVSEPSMEAATKEPVISPSEENKKISYSPAQIKRLKERDEIKQLLYIVERYIGKTLTGPEISTVLYFQDNLGFSVDLIEYLVEYCVTNQHISLRYMEKVANAWYDNGIRSISEARDYISINSKRTLAVSKAFGIGDRNLTPVEIDFINRWYDEYGFDKEIVAEACKRTIISMGKPNFSYTDGILKKWKSSNAHTLEDVKLLDAGFRARITVPVGTKPAAAKTVNKFNNFSQRSYNFDEMEKNLISNNK